MRKLPRVLVLWGVPGVGKSTFAGWLVKEKGFAHIDTDAQGAGASRAAKAWRPLLNGAGTPEEFMKIARYNPEPVVLEYGMFAYPAAIALLGNLRNAGAEPWWFDGDRPAAFAAWKAENVKSSRPFVDAKWHEVVDISNSNMPLITEFFGTNIARTIEAGPMHVPPQDTFKAMFGEIS
jgi:hypothetical protein